MSKQRAKGTRFETATLAYLRRAFADPDHRIQRLAPAGAYDRGDIGGVTVGGMPGGRPVVIECKDHASYNLPVWWDETVREMGNAGTDLGAVVFHRHGVRVTPERMGDQYVVMDLKTFVRALGGIPLAFGEDE